MNPELKSRLEPFFQTLARSPASALLLDYDGTLAPFQTRRDHAYPYPGVEPLLQEIVRCSNTRLVIVTGREAPEVLSLLNLQPRPEVWGIHGLQRLRIDGTLEMPLLDQRTLTALADAGGCLDHLQLRHVAEFKSGSIAVHWRGLSEIEAEDVRSSVLLGWRPIAESSGMDLLQFDGGIEIRPSQANKGKAVRAFLSEIPPATPVAYLGDDITDESAFHALHGRGIGILVRPTWRQTAAQFWLQPPEELREFLELWLSTRNGVEKLT